MLKLFDDFLSWIPVGFDCFRGKAFDRWLTTVNLTKVRNSNSNMILYPVQMNAKRSFSSYIYSISKHLFASNLQIIGTSSAELLNAWLFGFVTPSHQCLRRAPKLLKFTAFTHALSLMALWILHCTKLQTNRTVNKLNVLFRFQTHVCYGLRFPTNIRSYAYMCTYQ